MVSPLLIVIRVALGRGWARNTAETAFSSAEFQAGHPSTAASGEIEHPMGSIETVVGFHKTAGSSTGSAAAVSGGGVAETKTSL